MISFGCKPTGKLRCLKVDTTGRRYPADRSPCPCGEVHHVTVSGYRRRCSAEEPFDFEVASLDELR